MSDVITTTGTEAVTTTKTVCPHCRSEIEVTAVKCPRCRSFLGRLSWLRNATTELSVVSILVAVFALSLPAIKSLLPQKSDLIVAVLKTDGGIFEFMVSNKGNRPAAITQAGLEFPSSYKGDKLHNWVALEESSYKALVVEPEKSYRFAANLAAGLPPMMANPGLSVEIPGLVKQLPESCTLKLVYSDFDGTEHVIRRPYRCLAG